MGCNSGFATRITFARRVIERGGVEQGYGYRGAFPYTPLYFNLRVQYKLQSYLQVVKVVSRLAWHLWASDGARRRGTRTWAAGGAPPRPRRLLILPPAHPLYLEHGGWMTLVIVLYSIRAILKRN